jgi:hypothetical protein
MKHFNKQQTRFQLKNSIKTLAKTTGVKRVTYNNRAIYVDGTYNHKTKVIFISSRLTKKNILQTFFHEFAHHIACGRGQWKKYHTQEVTNSEYAFLIENRIDRLARKLWNRYVDSFIWGKYHFTYVKKDKRMYMKFLDDFYGI